MKYDVLIVGGGPAGIATAIKLKQLEQATQKEISVCIIEKGSEIGSHILSGNVFQPLAFDELFPDWRNMEERPPLDTPVTQDEFLFLTSDKKAFKIPNFLLPKALHNTGGNYIISLGNLCKWMAQQAENMGVDIFPGTPGAEIMYNQENAVIGILTKEMGIDKKGEKKDNYQDGIEILAKQTVFAEGVRGSLSEKVIEKFDLRKNCDPQIYGIGLKEVWEVDNSKYSQGFVQHTVGWPLDNSTYGGSFMYHMAPNLIHIGYVVGLQYQNPYLNPYEEFQQFKAHPHIRPYLEGGRCISYGARALNAGGYYSIPKLTFPGGVLTGCSAGFLNVLKIKGSHNAIKSGIIAGETIFDKLTDEKIDQEQSHEVVEYEMGVKDSWIYDELRRTRNVKGAFKYGKYAGMINSGVIEYFTKGYEPWKFRYTKKDCDQTQRKVVGQKIQYPKHDGVLSFDLLENLQRSGTYHDHDQPSHLKIKQGYEKHPLKSLNNFDGPEQRFCPAKVYEFVEDEKGQKQLQINAQNCLHCKTCSIKMFEEYIDWTVPEGSGGPNYAGM